MTLPTTEASIQATLKAALETLGYTVLEVAKGRSAKAAGAWTGTTPGTPDLFASHEAWGMPVWIGIELKTPTGKVRPEQKELNDKGLAVIARSVHEGLFAVVLREWIWFAGGGLVAARITGSSYLEDHDKRYRALCKMYLEFGGDKEKL